MNAGNRKEPNLFAFGTSELSQDAVICWLLAWAWDQFDHGNESLATMARSFAARLISATRGFEELTQDDIVAVRCIAPQYAKIDVYVEVEVRGHGVVYLVIEDKTDTSHHGDQLERYKEQVAEPRACIYFKTGFWTDYDRLAISQHEYEGFTSDDFSEFLGPYAHAHPILEEYSLYLAESRRQAVACEKAAVSNDVAALSEALSQPRGQWALMRHLFREPTDQFEATPPPALAPFQQRCLGLPAKNEMTNGSSRGAPWTQFHFHACQETEETEPEFLFYRLDFRSRAGDWIPCLSLRKYMAYDKQSDAAAPELSAQRLERFREAAGQAIERVDAAGVIPGGGAGNWEQQIAVFGLGPNGLSPDELRASLPAFHEQFLEGLAAAGLERIGDHPC